MNDSLTPTNNYFYTTDLCMATVLSLYFTVVDIDCTNFGRATFCFERTNELLQTVQQYHSYSINLPPQQFLEKYKNMKARVSDHLRSHI